MQNYGSPTLNEDGGPVKVYSDAYEACAGSNAIIIVTDFDEFRNEPINSPPATQSAGKKAASKQQQTVSKEEPTSIQLDRYNVEPDCAADCPDCHANHGEDDHTYTPKEQLDWSRVSSEMKSPKWLFDGRCIIDSAKMSKLGIRVESIGSASLTI